MNQECRLVFQKWWDLSLPVEKILHTSDETFRKQKGLTIGIPNPHKLNIGFSLITVTEGGTCIFRRRGRGMNQCQGSWTWIYKGSPAGSAEGKKKKKKLLGLLFRSRKSTKTWLPSNVCSASIASWDDKATQSAWTRTLGLFKECSCVSLVLPPPRPALCLYYCLLRSNQNWGIWGKPLTGLFPQLLRNVYWGVVFFKASNKKYAMSSVPLFF